MKTIQHALVAAMTVSMLLTAAACAGPGPSNPERISVAEAEHLIRARFLEEKPEMNPAVAFPVSELTTDEVWERLGAQVFQVREGIYQFYTFLIKDQEVVALGTGWGGRGLTSMCVTDLDRNGSAELVYTYSFGSGIHRSHLAMYCAGLPAPHGLEAAVAYRDDDWMVEKLDDQTVLVTVEREGPGDTLRLGRVVLEREGEQIELALRLDEDLPEDVLERLWALRGTGAAPF